jgi:hypothetical protein
MIPIYTDYETFWDVGYTLSKMTPLEYIYDERFELQTASTIVGDSDEVVFTVGLEETREFLMSLPLSNAMLISHNGNEFDHMISRWVLGLNPKMWGDTLAMARPHHAKTGLSLAKLAAIYSKRAKGDILATNTKGKRLAEFSHADLMKMKAYNDDDTLILRDIFRGLAKKTSADEMRLIDQTARMIVDPQFVANVDLLERGLKAEQTRKKRQLKRLADLLGMDTSEEVPIVEGVEPMAPAWEEEIRKTCSSAPKFKKLLASMGVECPMKTSPTTGKEIPALAKTDKGMEELLEHDNELVQAAAEARLGVKSTQLETRIVRFLDAARLCGGELPIPLRYAGADTTLRFSGTFKLNMQNLPRTGGKPKISDVLRYSLMAPDGYVVIAPDLSAIELRVNHFLWQEEDTMARFNADPEADVYRAFAGTYLYHVLESEVTKLQRFVGKVAQLQLGYYSGAPKLQDAARIMSEGEVLLTFPEAKNIVETWRSTYNKIVAGWHRLGESIEVMHDGKGIMPLDPWGLCIATRHGIKTPKALLTYPQLHKREVERFGKMTEQWFYKSSRGIKPLHGGILDENLGQHLAGQVMKDAIIRFNKTGLPDKYCYRPNLAHQVHDEMIYVVKAKDAQRVLDKAQECMRTRPEWWPELVVWSEGSIASCYGKTK